MSAMPHHRPLPADNMSHPISLSDLRAVEVVAPDDRSMTRFAPFVSLPPETLLALADAVEAAQRVLDEYRAPRPDGVAEAVFALNDTLARFTFAEDA